MSEETKKHNEKYADEMIKWIDERIIGIQEDKVTIEYLNKIIKINHKQVKNTIDSMSLSIEYMDKQINDDPMMPERVKDYLCKQLEAHALIKE